MIALTRRTLLLSAAAAAIASTLPAQAQTDDGALGQPLRALYAALEATMRAGRSTPFSQRFDALAPAVDQAFDLETVLKVSVGLRWDTMDADVKARLFKAYRRFTVATYVANFDKNDGEHFQILPGVRESGTDRIVATEIINGGQPTRLDYVMRDGSGNWKAVDVLLDGSISRVAVQRSDFRKILESGDTDALISSLQRKIADLSDGALSS
ncbi:MAG TPA: ABC transporter substrate-binding protein [Rhodopila sp.]|jgi:phospholipid transport system substrate-binding protein